MNSNNPTIYFGIGLPHADQEFGGGAEYVGDSHQVISTGLRDFSDLLAASYRLRILGKYEGITDTPAVPYFAQFDKLFLENKFILRIRDTESWLRCCR